MNNTKPVPNQHHVAMGGILHWTWQEQAQKTRCLPYAEKKVTAVQPSQE